MAGSIYDWSLVAGDNDDADADINWLENQWPDTVNDSARQMMGRNAEWRDDLTGTLTTAGTANARTLSARSAFASLANGRKLSFRSNLANTGATTINVNGLGAKEIRVMGVTTDVALVAGDLKANGVYTIMYSTTANAGAGAWMLFAPVSKVDGFAAGTRMLFQQTTAPTGWTKITTHNDKALRLVNGTAGSGGTIAFTDAFTSRGMGSTTGSATATGTVGDTTLTAAQIPAHTHGPGTLAGVAASGGAHTHGPGTLAGVTNTTGAHVHNPGTAAANFWTQIAGGFAAVGSGSGTTATNSTTDSQGNHSHTVDVNSGATASGGAHTHTVDVNAGATASAGTGGSHTHTFTGNAHSHSFSVTMDFSVQYVDVILCEKAA